MAETKWVSIANQLERDIQRGMFGKKLPGRSRLAKQYDTTHITLGKSMQHLEDRGLLQTKGTSGTFVKPEAGVLQRYRRVALVAMIRHENREVPFIDAVAQVCEKHDYKIAEIKLRPEDNDDHLAAYLSSMQVDGFIFLFMEPSSVLIRQLDDKGIPFVCAANMDDEALTCVDADNLEGLRLVMDTLQELGHRRIATVNFNFRPTQHMRLRQAFEASNIAATGDSGSELYYCNCNQVDYFTQYGDDYAKALGRDAARYCLALAEPPTAAYITPLPAARTFIEEFAKANRSVPEGLSVIVGSFDESEAEKHPSLTMLEHPRQQLLALATERLLARIDTPELPGGLELLPRRLVNPGASIAPNQIGD